MQGRARHSLIMADDEAAGPPKTPLRSPLDTGINGGSLSETEISWTRSQSGRDLICCVLYYPRTRALLGCAAIEKWDTDFRHARMEGQAALPLCSSVAKAVRRSRASRLAALALTPRVPAPPARRKRPRQRSTCAGTATPGGQGAPPPPRGPSSSAAVCPFLAVVLDRISASRRAAA